MSGRVSVVPSGKVPVVGGDDGVLLSLLDVLPVPLSDAGPASVGQHDAAELSHGVSQTVPLDGSPDLLGAGGDVEGALGLEAVAQGLLHDGGHSAHVLVRRVSAGANQAVFDFQGPSVGLGSLAQRPDGGGQVGGEGSVDVGLQGAQVDVNHLERKQVKPSRLDGDLPKDGFAPICLNQCLSSRLLCEKPLKSDGRRRI